MLFQTISQRIAQSLWKSPAHGWMPIWQITLVTTASAGVGSVATGFIRPIHDFAPPQTNRDILRVCSTFLVPGLLEELLWRAALVPTPPAAGIPLTALFFQQGSKSIASSPALIRTALTVLVIHVCSHPIFSAVAYPRGKQVFSDVRFLFLASIVLGGSTLSYIASGGSVWAAALTHTIPVILWRDFFGGEKKLQGDLLFKG